MSDYIAKINTFIKLSLIDYYNKVLYKNKHYLNYTIIPLKNVKLVKKTNKNAYKYKDEIDIQSNYYYLSRNELVKY